MKLSDVQIKVTTDYEFWEQVVRVMEVIKKQKVSDELRHLFVLGLSMRHDSTDGFYDEPFTGKPFHKLVEYFGNSTSARGTNYAYPYITASQKKKQFKELGWIGKDSKLTKEWKQLQQAYRQESKMGIKSLSFIYKICIC